MNGRFWNRFALQGVAMLLAGVGSAHAGVSDAWISAKVKMALLNSPQVSGIPIDVDTDNGRVTLHGRVPSMTEKKEADRIARAGTGVASVRDLLQIVPNSRRKIVAAKDDRIQDDVSAALKAEPALGNSSIHVKSVTKGAVLLSGKAASLSDHLEAIEVAASVPGVRQVASEIDSPDAFSDQEIWNDAPVADPSHGNRVTDGWITTQIKMHYMTDELVPAGDINVDTRRGAVTLFGTVPTMEASERAKTLAKDVSGVTAVKSELRVIPASMKKLATAVDDDIASMLRKRIANADMKGADIKVEVKAQTARMSGTVQSASDRYSALAIAHGTPGVARVANDLRVQTPEAAAH